MYVDADDCRHAASRELLETDPGPLVVPTLVITEVAYLMATRLDWQAEVRFLGDLAGGTLTLEPVHAADPVRMAELVARLPRSPARHGGRLGDRCCRTPRHHPDRHHRSPPLYGRPPQAHRSVRPPALTSGDSLAGERADRPIDVLGQLAGRPALGARRRTGLRARDRSAPTSIIPHMGKRSRRTNHPRQPALPAPPATTADPERLLLDVIADGDLDDHLPALADAIHARQQLLETIGSAKALAMLNVGDRVRFNNHTRPQYLRGVEGVVIELDQQTATVCVHQPVGRFKSGEIRRCPPLLLDRLHPAA